jgi:hypothetical protein
MADDKKISELTSASSLGFSDLIPVVTNMDSAPTTKFIQYGKVGAVISGCPNNLVMIGSNGNNAVDSGIALSGSFFPGASIPIDSTLTRNSGSLTLASVGVSGSYNQVQTDSFGRVTSGSFKQISSQFFLSPLNGVPSLTQGATASKIQMPTNKQNIEYASFLASGSPSYFEWSFSLPSDYNGGALTPVFTWFTTASAVSGSNVVWGLQGRAYGDGDNLDSAWGSAQEIMDTTTSASYINRISASASPVILSGSPAAGQLAQIRAYRKGIAPDNLSATAFLVGVQVNYTRI